jgi:hypothetical protein
MGKSSRQKRRTYQTPKRSRSGSNLVWYAAAAILVIGGSLAVALSRANSGNAVGPQATDHWHAALGVNDCGKWTPNWLTPFSGGNPSTPVHAGTTVYAGMHSHGDGLIHMEPNSSADMGKRATLGNYFKSAGFKLDATSITFGNLDPSTTVIEKNGNKCNGKPGLLRWSVNGKEKKGNPASYKIFNGDVIELVFTTADAKLPKKSEVPSYAELQSILGNPNRPEPAPGVTTPANTAPAATDTTPPTTAPGAVTTTTPGGTTTAPSTTAPSGSTTTPSTAGTTSSTSP